ncbi:hypothetical protein COOONC_01996 [Cooperia oncophora]
MSSFRSVSAVETSGRLGGMASRRLFDQQRYGAAPSSTTTTSPRRTQNYLAQKMAGASSLMQSRLLARSVGNVSLAAEGEVTAAASRLQNTIDMLKKASNPDLTQTSLYEDPGSPCGEKMRRRGAVQKKVLNRM